MMTDAPERIWAAPPWDDPAWESGAGEWDISEMWAVDNKVAYTRADGQLQAGSPLMLGAILIALLIVAAIGGRNE